MGNGLAPCCYSPAPMSTRLVFWGGSCKLLQGIRQAGDIMRESPGYVVCHGDSFYIGLPVPVLSIGDNLLPGETYFVLPVDRLPYDRGLTAASLAHLSPNPNVKPSTVGLGDSLFEHVENEDGSIVIRVLAEFIERVISSAPANNEKCAEVVDGGVLCDTSELKEHYTQLVGPRDRQWSPRLETIEENSKKERPEKLKPAKLFRFQTGKAR